MLRNSQLQPWETRGKGGGEDLIAVSEHSLFGPQPSVDVGVSLPSPPSSIPSRPLVASLSRCASRPCARRARHHVDERIGETRQRACDGMQGIAGYSQTGWQRARSLSY